MKFKKKVNKSIKKTKSTEETLGFELKRSKRDE